MQSRQEGIKIAQVAKGVTVSAPVDGVILDLPAISMTILGATAVSSFFIFRIIRKKKELETPNFKDSHR